MSHGIQTTRDFVYGLVGQGKDWHKLTIEKDSLSKSDFPTFTPEFLTARGIPTGFQILIADDDNLPIAKPFQPDSFGYVLPQKAWEMVSDALEGTRYSVERVGMLWDRSFWFVSIALEEFKTVARNGEAFRLNFSGALDGSASPQGELSHIRAVCWNTISASRATKEYLFKIRQSKNSGSKVDAAKADVERAVGMAEIFNRTLATLESKPATETQARELFAGEVASRMVKAQGLNVEEVFRTGTTKTGEKRESRSLNQVQTLVELFQKGDGNKGQTRADVLNGFTQLLTRGGSEDSQKNVWKAIESSEFGNNGGRKADFFTTLSDDKATKELAKLGKVALAGAND